MGRLDGIQAIIKTKIQIDKLRLKIVWLLLKMVWVQLTKIPIHLRWWKSRIRAEYQIFVLSFKINRKNRELMVAKWRLFHVDRPTPWLNDWRTAYHETREKIIPRKPVSDI